MATEMLGMIYGEYTGSVRELGPGCLSCENSYMPHGGGLLNMHLEIAY